MRLLIIRHGETTSSRLGHFTGRREVDLSEAGHAQARQWESVLKEFTGSSNLTVSCSPLRRCVDTARDAGLEPEIWPELAEWDLGELDGINADDYRRANPGWSLFVDGPPAAAGESPESVQRRAHTVLQRVAGIGHDVILFTHGQFAKALVAAALGLPPAASARFALGPCRGALFIDRLQGLSLAGWNIAPSLDRLWSELT